MNAGINMENLHVLTLDEEVGERINIWDNK